MLFSLVFPTRQRVELLRGLFTSLSLNTIDKNNVEILAVYDDDDTETQNACMLLLAQFPDLNIKFIRRPRSSNLNGDYITYGAKLAVGKYIHVLNDDVEFVSHGWDITARDALDAFLKDKPDGIVYAIIDDGMETLKQNQQLVYCGFPIISRKAMEILGYAMSPDFPSWGADLHLFRVFQYTGRVLDLRIVKVLHLSVHTGMRERDAVSYHVQEIWNPAQASHTWPVEEDYRKLMLAMGVENPPPISPVIPPPPKPDPPTFKPGPMGTRLIGRQGNARILNRHGQTPTPIGEAAMAALRRRINAMKKNP